MTMILRNISIEDDYEEQFDIDQLGGHFHRIPRPSGQTIEVIWDDGQRETRLQIVGRITAHEIQHKRLFEDENPPVEAQINVGEGVLDAVMDALDEAGIDVIELPDGSKTAILRRISS